MLAGIKYEKERALLYSDDEQVLEVPLKDGVPVAADGTADPHFTSYKTGAFAAQERDAPNAEERLAMLEAELAAAADPYAQAWEGAKTQIAQWAAFQQLLIEKGVVTQEELDAKAAAIEVAGDGQVTTRG